MIDDAREQQMAAPGLQEPAKKALATLDRESDGLAAHREYPMVSLDGNCAQRQIRGPVVTRKNAAAPAMATPPQRRRDLDRHRHRAEGRAERSHLCHRLHRPIRPRTAGNRSPARRWNGSCPRAPAPKTSRPGRSPRPQAKTRPITPASAWPARAATPTSACHFTGLPNTYITSACRSIAGERVPREARDYLEQYLKARRRPDILGFRPRLTHELSSRLGGTIS